VRRHIASIRGDIFHRAIALPDLPQAAYRRLADALPRDGGGFGCVLVEEYGNVVYSVADLRRFAERERMEIQPLINELVELKFLEAEKALKFRRGNFHLAHLTLVQLGGDLPTFRAGSLLGEHLDRDSLLRANFCEKMLKVASQEYLCDRFTHDGRPLYYSCEDVRDFLDRHPDVFQKDGKKDLPIPQAAFHVFKVLCVLESDETICRQVFLLHHCNFLRARATLEIIEPLRPHFPGAKILMQCRERRAIFDGLPPEHILQMTPSDIAFAESNSTTYVYTGLDVYDMNRRWPEARVTMPDWCWNVEGTGSPFRKVFADPRLVAQMVDEGCDPKIARNLLVLTRNNLTRAQQIQELESEQLLSDLANGDELMLALFAENKVDRQILLAMASGQDRVLWRLVEMHTWQFIVGLADVLEFLHRHPLSEIGSAWERQARAELMKLSSVQRADVVLLMLKARVEMGKVIRVYRECEMDFQQAKTRLQKRLDYSTPSQ
jgi:hypothetical protein